ncbi:MAG: eukaryotic-like serine/threonine-protein kinase [Thermoanaerobaculia bacterium]|jgi:Tol biopolymer transport system component|nr:eukaryotic-like serine/threonine-protein kinase [Thermoanaerobaculia bacterium]
MGEVYKASDTRLQRDVAIKVLPAEFARDAQLRARFEREARAISSLNHPNICMLFDVGSQHDVEYLVMEYLDGEPLSERLSRAPLPVVDVLRYGIEIADALDKAHRTGIIHRDLKPGNVILTRSGAKLLDFGLAKAINAALVASISPSSSTAIHVDDAITAEGVLMGTFCYMAPEQIEFGQSDARSDIFAFGCLMFEMLTGRRAFAAASRAGMIAQILAADPPSISSLRPMTPIALDRVVRNCLAKNPDDRFQTAHDVMLALQWIRDEQSSPSAPLPLARARGRMWGERAAWALALVLATGAAIGIATWSRREVSSLERPMIAAIVPPRGLRFVFTGDYAGSPVLSPDGRRVAFVAASPDGQRTLWVRTLDSADPRVVDNSDDAMFPFWAPDNRFLGFFAHGKLKTVDAAGGVPTVIADAPNARGGTWGDENVIVFTPETQAGLYRVAANGGRAVALTTPSGGMTTHRWPLFLPGGKSFLYLAANHDHIDSRDTALHVRSLDGKDDHVVTQTLANVAYVDGKLLMLHESTLVAQPFDVGRGVLTGTPSIVAQNIRFDSSTWHGVFDAAGRTLIYQAAGSIGTHLIWFGHDGTNLGALADVARYYDVKLSPDGRRLVTNAGEPTRAAIWVVDVAHNVRTRLTFEGSMNEAAVWSADGSEIIYAARDTPSEKAAIYRRRADGNGPRQLVARLDGDADPGAVSADGRWVAATLWRGRGVNPQIWAVPLVPNEKAHAVIAGEFATHDPRISPDGRWLAYTSNESGRDEIYVVPFLGNGGKWQVTTAGGHSSRWSPDGTHLDYLTSDNVLTEVDVKSGGGFEIGAARTLFRLDVNPVSSSDYDLTADGRVVANGGEADPSPLTLVANWQ